MKKRLADLTNADLGRKVGVDIGWQQIEKGTLTDYYGSMDEDLNAIVAVELDGNLTFFLPPNSSIFIEN
jgi:hypothetical protein